jgi:L-malate glycosyltransferase
VKPIRLLHLMKTFDIGGVERSTINYSNKLITLVNYIAIFAKKGKLNHSNIVDKKIAMFFSHGNISNTFTALFNLVEIAKIIAKNKINIVHYHQRIYIPYVVVLKVLFPRLKIIYTHHSVFNDNLNRFITADLIIAVSNATKKDLEKFSKSNAILINHGFGILQRQKGNSKRFKNIGYVGRFHKVKGIFCLLKAFKILRDKYSDINLILIGEGEEKKKIIHFIKINSLEERINIKESIISLSDIYDDLDCVVLPSERHEGFGLVLVEAMSFGIPVISSDLESLTEIVINNNTGLVFERGNVNSLKEQLERIIEDEPLRGCLIENSLKFVKDNYDIEASLKKYFERAERIINPC